MKPVQCPTCQLRWNIDELAHRVITCPRCLAALVNPYTETGSKVAKPPALPVRPVLPVDHQVARDKQTSNVGLMLVIAVLLAGIGLLIYSLINGAGVSVAGIIGLVVVTAAALVPVFIVAAKKPVVVPAIPMGAVASTVQPGGVLDYQRPLPDPRKLSPGAFFGQAIGGITLGIVGGACLTALLGQLDNGVPGLLGIAAPIIVGAILCTKPMFRGLGVGLILALPAAFLLLLGFCAILIGSGSFH